MEIKERIEALKKKKSEAEGKLIALRDRKEELIKECKDLEVDPNELNALIIQLQHEVSEKSSSVEMLLGQLEKKCKNV